MREVLCGLLLAVGLGTSLGAQTLGRPALPAEIAAWDVAVLPDGTGLPEGTGDVLTGEDLWIDRCATCHGAFGEGSGAFPIIAGGHGTLRDPQPTRTVGSYWPHVSTLWDYVHRSQPFGNAQTLSVDETYALVAYILYSNDLVDDDFVLSDANFLEVRLPNADGFFIDDRDVAEVPLFSAPPCMSDCGGPRHVTRRATDLQSTDEHLVPLLPPDRAAPSAPDLAAAPADDVVLLVRQCETCHSLQSPARGLPGPVLGGIVGRQAASGEGFRYSPALRAARAAGLVWTDEALDAFLADPAGFLPGTAMQFSGIPSRDERAAVILWLQQSGN